MLISKIINSALLPLSTLMKNAALTLTALSFSSTSAVANNGPMLAFEFNRICLSNVENFDWMIESFFIGEYELIREGEEAALDEIRSPGEFFLIRLTPDEDEYIIGSLLIDDFGRISNGKLCSVRTWDVSIDSIIDKYIKNFIPETPVTDLMLGPHRAVSYEIVRHGKPIIVHVREFSYYGDGVQLMLITPFTSIR